LTAADPISAPPFRAKGAAERPHGRHRQLIAIGAVSAGAAVLILGVVLLSVRASHQVNHVPLEAAPRPVTVIPARSASYQGTRTYVGAVEPWVEANVGPQYISAYVSTVAVRPGDTVKRGQILATLDCSNPNAATRAVEMQARAADARVRAASDEATRFSTMLDGGFVAPNEVEQKNAVSLAESAKLLETEANVVKTSLDVREKDLDALAPSTVVQVDILATGSHLSAPISRRAPRVDPQTRTIHFEVDVPDPERKYPVGATAIVHVAVGKSVPATEVPMYAATQDEGKAKLFVVDHDVAHAKTLLVTGEVGGQVFFGLAALPPGSLVVTEGRALLSDGDKVQAHVDDEVSDGGSPEGDAGPGTRGGGYGRSL
jgi:multidrug efflux pump subunit AcrA (membrane-fusion protein)